MGMANSEVAATSEEGMQAIGENLHPLLYEFIPTVHNSLLVSEEALPNGNLNRTRRITVGKIS